MEAGLKGPCRHRPANFDAPTSIRSMRYLVRLTKGREARCRCSRCSAGSPTEREPQWAPETVLRCEAPRDVWDVISPEARAEFNRRLKAEGKPSRALGRGRDSGATPLR